jgi:CDP-2,3-bis-(O-geranylgeranyl)-sn-glycerol synthase
MDSELIVRLLLMLVAANGVPVLIEMLFRERLAWPVDGGRLFVDGRRLFGAHKTVRGILGAVVASTLIAPVAGLDHLHGALFGLLAMVGDLVSSFIKRRADFAPGSKRLLLDQLPEACLPLWLLHAELNASLPDAAIAVTAFIAIDLLLSRLYRAGKA